MDGGSRGVLVLGWGKKEEEEDKADKTKTHRAKESWKMVLKRSGWDSCRVMTTRVMNGGTRDGLSRGRSVPSGSFTCVL